MIVVGFIAQLVPNAKNNTYGELATKRRSNNAIIGFIIVCLILILFSSFRDLYAVGNDEYAYRNRYDLFNSQSFFQVMSNDKSGTPLLTILFWISTRITTTNQGAIIITGFITVLFIMLTLRRDAKDFSFIVPQSFFFGNRNFDGQSHTVCTIINPRRDFYG